jgi:PAS domain S-box-containing protein
VDFSCFGSAKYQPRNWIFLLKNQKTAMEKEHTGKTTRRLTKRDQPEPIDQAIEIPEDYTLISKTDPKGIITDGNEAFEEVSGYSKHELMGSSHNVIRHPDMPKVMFKLIWDRINDKENILAIIKNLAKDGRYYWVATDFITRVNADREILEYTAYRKPVCREVIDAIERLYDVLNAIERFSGMEDAENYLQYYFEKNQTNYDDFIEDLMIEHCQKPEMAELRNRKKEGTLTEKDKKNFFAKLFGL